MNIPGTVPCNRLPQPGRLPLESFKLLYIHTSQSQQSQFFEKQSIVKWAMVIYTVKVIHIFLFQWYLSMPPLALFSWIFPFESAAWYPFSTWCTEALWQGWSDSPFVVGRLLWNLSHTPTPACRRKGKNPTWALETAECRRTALCHKQEHARVPF